MTRTEAGLALRSTDRATPTVILGLAMLLGAGVTALWRRGWLLGILAAVVAGGVVIAADPPVFNGTTVADHFTIPAHPPSYVTRAADALNAEHQGTRVLAIPGENFAAYRYGDYIDPVWPGLLTRPFVTREQQALGSLASYDLLYGLDNPMQNGIVEPDAIAPLARLMSAGDVLVQNDLAYERYNSPRPLAMAQALTPTPPGLSAPVGYGAPRPDICQIPLTDEEALATSPDQPWPAPVQVMAVADPRPIVRGESTAGELVVDGDGVGLDEAASAGLLNTDSAILYAGTLDTHPSAEAQALASNSTLVVTDSNRKEAFRWNTILGNAGATLTKAQPQPTDPNNAPLDLFPGAPADAQTTVALQGVDAITASSYGNVDDYLPEDRPSQALDGNLDTAWETGAFTVPLHQWWQVVTHRPPHHRPRDPGPTAVGREQPVDHQGHADLRRPLPGDGGPGTGVTDGGGTGDRLPDADVHDAAGHHRRHEPGGGQPDNDPERLPRRPGRGRGGRRPGTGGRRHARRPPRRGRGRLAVPPVGHRHDP